MIGLLSRRKVHPMSEHSTVEISKASAVVFWSYLCLMFLEICVIWKIYIFMYAKVWIFSEWLLKIYFPIGQKVQVQKFLHQKWDGWLAGVWFCFINFLIGRSIEQFFGKKIWSFFRKPNHWSCQSVAVFTQIRYVFSVFINYEYNSERKHTWINYL